MIASPIILALTKDELYFINIAVSRAVRGFRDSNDDSDGARRAIALSDQIGRLETEATRD